MAQADAMAVHSTVNLVWSLLGDEVGNRGQVDAECFEGALEGAAIFVVVPKNLMSCVDRIAYEKKASIGAPMTQK